MLSSTCVMFSIAGSLQVQMASEAKVECNVMPKLSTCYNLARVSKPAIATKGFNDLGGRLVTVNIQSNGATLDSRPPSITPKQLYLFTSSPDCLGRTGIFMACVVWMIVVAKGGSSKVCSGSDKEGVV